MKIKQGGNKMVMGRPKSENPKNIKITVRLDEATDEKLTKIADKHNTTKAEFIRCLLLEEIKRQKI